MIGCHEERRPDHANGTRFYFLVGVRLFVSDSDLGPTAQQHGDLVVKQREQELKLYIRETFRKRTQYRFQPRKMRGIVHRQRQSMLDPCRYFSRKCLQVRTPFDDAPCIHQEAFPFCRQRGISSASVKQQNPQVGLQIGNRRADDGLGLAEAPGGCRKRSGIRRCIECLQLFYGEVHLSVFWMEHNFSISAIPIKVAPSSQWRKT